MDKKEKMKMAVVAGASYAIRYKEEHPKATESETMSYVTKSMRKIIRDVEEG
jgi:hypothetical protein